VQIMVKTQPMDLEAAVESSFASMAEGRVADVVDHSKRFGEIFVEA